MLRGPWVPAFAGKTRGGRKAGAQEPWWCRCHGTGLSAVGFSPARCLSGFKKKALSVLRRLGWFDVLLVAIQSSAVPGSRRSPGKRGVGKRGPRSRGGAAAKERASAQRGFRRHDAWPRWLGLCSGLAGELLDAHGEIDGAEVFGQGTGGDAVGLQGLEAIEAGGIDIARNFHLGAASDEGQGPAGIVVAEFVQHDGVRTGGQSLLQLRSEEHTSELQSRGHLVCRLLL